MRKTRRTEGTNPLCKAHGERVYELIGAGADLGGTKHHSVAEIVIPPGGRSSTHYHQASEETYYIRKGNGLLILNDKPYPVTEGDAMLIEPGERHQIRNPSDVELVFIAVSAPPWHPEDSVFV